MQRTKFICACDFGWYISILVRPARCAMACALPQEKWLSEKQEVHEFPSSGLRYSEGYSRGLSAFQRDYLWESPPGCADNHQCPLSQTLSTQCPGSFAGCMFTGVGKVHGAEP